MTEISAARPEDVGLCSRRIGRVETWMQQQVSGGRLAAVEVMINRRGRTAFHRCHGKADLARGADATPETIYRIYSMTKALTAVAVMMLYEEGRFQLDNSITRYLPEFRGQRVFTGGGYGAVTTEPAQRSITFRDLLTHTSGLTYGFMQATPVDAIYRAQRIELPGADAPLADIIARLAQVPLIAQPGAEWNYSIASDLLGHLVAVISGQPFEVFLRERVIRPLGMTDTDFFVPSDKAGRFAANYGCLAERVEVSLERLHDVLRIQVEFRHDLRERVPLNLRERQEDVLVGDLGVVPAPGFLDSAVHDPLC